MKIHERRSLKVVVSLSFLLIYGSQFSFTYAQVSVFRLLEDDEVENIGLRKALAWRTTESERLVYQTQDLPATMSLMQFSMGLMLLPPVSCMLYNIYTKYEPLSYLFLSFNQIFYMGFPLVLKILIFFSKILCSNIFASNQEGSAFDFGELEQAIALQGVKFRNDEAKACKSFFLFLIIYDHVFLFCDVVVGETKPTLPKAERRERGV